MNMRIMDYDLLSIQEARILVENAHEAQKTMATFSQEKLDEIVECMAKEISKHTERLAKLSWEETDYGKWEDKYIKNRFASEYLPTKLKGMNCVGIISSDEEQQMMDVGVPLGVIVGLSPATSPVSTSIYTALVALKAGNALIISPHPRAQKCIMETLDIMIEAAQNAGMPEGALTYLSAVTQAGTKELMNHSDVSLIINTGVPAMLEEAYSTGKPVIYGGAGNGPAFIERTANIEQAVKDIIASKTFDNGMVSAAEQSIVVDSCIANQVKDILEKNGGYFMSEKESEIIGKMFYYNDGRTNPALVGRSARELAQMAGFQVPQGTRILISKQKYVSETNPYSREKLCPVLAYFIEDDWMNACEKCIELLLFERNGHTLVIHSNDREVIKQFALKKPVGRMLVNTPAVFGSMGATTNLFPAMTLGSGSAGDGITSDNVSPMNLIYIRKVGYGVRRIEDIGMGTPEGSAKSPGSSHRTYNDDSLRILQEILQQAIAGLEK